MAILDGLDGLRNHRGMSVILIAHGGQERIEPPDKPAYNIYGPRLHKKAAPVVREWADEVLYATFKVDLASEKEGFEKTRTTVVGGGERVIYTTPNPAWRAKNRIGLPDTLPMVYAEYHKHLTK